ncbi:MAG TPA: YifB family Mg chelatase-like AAA ATPase [Treponemataceae bacterium]|nr:YifB family Mg chelatase-like AAA ATPase [Treponemataceae bacterium]
MQITSFSPFGYEGAMVTVEVDLRRGIPAVDLVGLADNAVKEARERMRAAIRNSGFDFPPERVLISLSPADVKKEGAGFDLAMALAVLYKKTQLTYNKETTKITQVLVMGELELSGRVRRVRGVHAAVSTAAENGICFCIVPHENAEEAAGVDGMSVFAVETLESAWKIYTHLPSIEKKEKETKKNTIASQATNTQEAVEFAPIIYGEDFSGVVGQSELIRALQIAAAGRHNVIAYGPPGCGKTLALRRFSSLLPQLTLEESQPVTRIYSIAGCLPVKTNLMRTPPFRMPHQSASLEGLIGGGKNCRPGEISLAHNGVLFLDEAAEFKVSVLQSLRVPLEEGRVVLSRAGRRTEFPAHFQLLIAANPCPCGNFGSDDKICVCSARSVEQYWRRFSAPLLDRIDIRVAVKANTADKTVSGEQAISTQELRKNIAVAVAIQRKRQGKPNAWLTPSETVFYCKLNEESKTYLEKQTNEQGFSSRAVHSCMKLARTIADMVENYDITIEHLKEAIEIRKSEAGSGILF